MFSKIVVGTDGSETAAEAVSQAADLAKEHGAALHLVSAYEPVSEARQRQERSEAPRDMEHQVNPREDVNATLADAEEKVKQSGLEQVETHSREGDPADIILDVCDEQSADLVVVGNKGMTGARRFLLGSVPNKVSHHANCSVLIVKTS